MGIYLMQIVILALATAALSTTTARASIFASTREWIFQHNEWLGKLVSCPYCMSHWVAIALVAIYRPILVSQWIVADLIVSVFSVVALSALISGMIMKLIPFRQPESDDDEELNEEVEQLRSALHTARDTIVKQKRMIEELREKEY